MNWINGSINMSKTIYNIENYPNYRIVRNGNKYTVERFNKLMFFKWWGDVYVNRGNGYYWAIETYTLDSAKQYLNKYIHDNDDSIESHEKIKL